MIEFLQANWFYLVVAVLGLIEFFLLIFKKNKIIDSALTSLLEVLPGMVTAAETLFGAGRGQDKLQWVVKIAQAYYESLGGQNEIDSIIFEQIEKILATPEKKG